MSKTYHRVEIPKEAPFQSRRIDAGDGGFRVSKEEPAKVWLDDNQANELRKMGYRVSETEKPEPGPLSRERRGSGQRRGQREGRSAAEAMRQEEWPVGTKIRKRLAEHGIRTRAEVAASDKEDLIEVEGIGDTTATELLDWASGNEES